VATAHGTAIDLADGTTAPGMWLRAEREQACLAHGAGAGMVPRSMSGLAEGLAERHVSTLRYEFPFMARGGARRPDAPEIAHRAVRAAIALARRDAPSLPLFAGGRSYGGRMTSQAQAAAPLEGVRGLVFFAFPLHPAGRPSVDRAAHLAQVEVPMLFLQGTRDALDRIDLLRSTIAGLDAQADLELAIDADHAFHVPARSGQTDAAVPAGILDAAAAWILRTAGARDRRQRYV
jgi:predicted alpha/beta-hydrolase family hydrolase